MKKFVKTIILILITLHVAWSVYEYFWYSSLIPAKIGIAYPINISGQSDLREGCGTAIFGITNATADAISRQGIDFLATLSIPEEAKISTTPIERGKKHQFPRHGLVKALGQGWAVRV
ncbi:hypothetical protein [Chroococcidiopsis sp. CCNUC1]|uniref:hypothetical protein n=1 Tax=Chroococcidiopsis sp. CCNUC1 TaxID=2653189 RepID=UPI002022097D|nr:hypothetical protein [Chroococcidiopsis sp. CCNUC1]URD51681.1 hypothetical protein M5J74_06735 [Chroococcidiopsis sp. CCNUC1]